VGGLGGAQLQGDSDPTDPLRHWQQRRVAVRDKVESTTDPDARLYKKASADKAVPSYQATR